MVGGVGVAREISLYIIGIYYFNVEITFFSLVTGLFCLEECLFLSFKGRQAKGRRTNIKKIFSDA